MTSVVHRPRPDWRWVGATATAVKPGLPGGHPEPVLRWWNTPGRRPALDAAGGHHHPPLGATAAAPLRPGLGRRNPPQRPPPQGALGLGRVHHHRDPAGWQSPEPDAPSFVDGGPTRPGCDFPANETVETIRRHNQDTPSPPIGQRRQRRVARKFCLADRPAWAHQQRPNPARGVSLRRGAMWRWHNRRSWTTCFALKWNLSASVGVPADAEDTTPQTNCLSVGACRICTSNAHHQACSPTRQPPGANRPNPDAAGQTKIPSRRWTRSIRQPNMNPWGLSLQDVSSKAGPAWANNSRLASLQPDVALNPRERREKKKSIPLRATSNANAFPLGATTANA